MIRRMSRVRSAAMAVSEGPSYSASKGLNQNGIEELSLDAFLHYTFDT